MTSVKNRPRTYNQVQTPRKIHPRQKAVQHLLDLELSLEAQFGT